MRIYGAGSIEEVKHCTELGAVGILTNPQGFEQFFRGEMTLEEITRALIEATDLPVFIQIHGNTVDALVERGWALHGLSPRVGFKIIANEKGFRAIRRLQADGISCIATGLFSISQAATAAAVGAFGICPFVARAQDAGIDVEWMLETIRAGYEELSTPPEIIAVSLRSLSDVERALAAGVDAVGMRWPLMQKMFAHPLSDQAELLFAKNWAKVKGENIEYLHHAMRMEGMAE